MNLLPSLVQRALARGVPVGATIELLAPCNLDCVHCYVTHSKKMRLTLPVLRDLFGQLAASGAFSVTLTGGEIALRKDLFQIVAAARARHFAVRLLSSGTRWNAREWDRIAALAVQDVRVSLYALDPAVHDAVTQTPGSHARTMATIAGLRARGVPMTLACSVLSVNAHEVAGVVDFAREHDIDIGIDPKVTWTDRGDQRPAAARADFDALLAVYQSSPVRELFVKSDESCTPPPGNDSPCLVGRLSPFIQCTGDVYPCGNWPRPGGNILDQPYLEIVQSSAEFEYARRITNSHMHGCAGCGDHPFCSPCVAMSLQEHGHIATPTQDTCDIAAAVAVAATGSSKQRRQGRPRLCVVA